MYDFIDDGMEVSGYISGAANHYRELRFHYRPMRDDERVACIYRLDKLSENKRSVLEAEYIAKHIASWNRDRPATAENLLRLPVALYHRLRAIVTGMVAPDEDPEAPKTLPDQISVASHEAEALATGSSFQGAVDAAAEKN